MQGYADGYIHLEAITGRIGVQLKLEDRTSVGRGTPIIVDRQFSAVLMEEFYYTGGLPRVLPRLGDGSCCRTKMH